MEFAVTLSFKTYLHGRPTIIPRPRPAFDLVHCNVFLLPYYAKIRFVLCAPKVLVKRMLLNTCVLACKINMSGMLITRPVFMVIANNATLIWQTHV